MLMNTKELLNANSMSVYFQENRFININKKTDEYEYEE